jgi:two-component system phosphate regulon sensor histidine kinase PhoR
MWFRLLAFLMMTAVGLISGAWWQPGWPDGPDWQGATVGAVAGATLWVLLDLWRGRRVIRWVLREDFQALPTQWGLWGEVADRVRRLHRRLRQEILRSDERLARLTAAIQASPNGVLLLDPDDHIEWCNQTAAEHLGLDAQRDRLQRITHMVRDPAFNGFMQASSGEQGLVMDSRLSQPHVVRKIALQWFPTGDGHRLLLSRDITALEQAETMRRDFVANVSHEIRTPLTVLSGFVETLQTLPLVEEEHTRYLALMAQQSHRMQALVADLLTLSRLEGSPQPGMSERTPVAVLWQACVQDARGLAGGAHEGAALTHALVFHLDPDLQDESVAGSRAELQSAMSNFISNAIRYTPAGGRVEIGWRMHLPQGVEFWVQDNGPGIAPEHLPRLTERFYRVDRSRSRETGGTGLGLAIVKHVVQRHGQGARFAFHLPLARFVHSGELNAGLAVALGPAQEQGHQQ